MVFFVLWGVVLLFVSIKVLFRLEVCRSGCKFGLVSRG